MNNANLTDATINTITEAADKAGLPMTIYRDTIEHMWAHCAALCAEALPLGVQRVTVLPACWWD